jgi:hypothetical protein
VPHQSHHPGDHGDWGTPTLGSPGPLGLGDMSLGAAGSSSVKFGIGRGPRMPRWSQACHSSSVAKKNSCANNGWSVCAQLAHMVTVETPLASVDTPGCVPVTVTCCSG